MGGSWTEIRSNQVHGKLFVFMLNKTFEYLFWMTYSQHVFTSSRGDPLPIPNPWEYYLTRVGRLRFTDHSKCVTEERRYY